MAFSASAALQNVEGFEGYSSSAQLQASWVATAGAPVVLLETNTVCEGSKSMALSYSGALAFTNLVRYTFATNQNWATNSTFQFRCGGLANSNDAVLVRLLDQSGTVLQSTPLAGGTASVPCSVGSMNLGGGAGLGAVRALELGVIGGAADHSGTVYFDALKVGDVGLLSVLGSSLAKGYNASGASANMLTNGSFLNSYAALLTGSQGAKGWRVVNQSVGGDTTAAVSNRFYTDEVPVGATEDLIALSLGNEGLPGAANPQAIYNQFFTGITNLIALSRANNILPLLGNGYPRDAYTAAEYGYLKQMELQLNALNVPSLNFLGATDDGAGHWISNSFINLGSGDGIHPNDTGHQEMFLTIVPSVFDAVRQGKPTPRWGNRARSLRILGDVAPSAPLRLDASPMHSFSVSFRVRGAGTGTVAAITLPSGLLHPTVEIAPGGIAYVGTNGIAVNSGVSGTNGTWHDVAIAHQYGRGLTFFYLDGIPIASVPERLAPIGFVLGGRGSASSRPGPPVQADYQDWCVHRSMLNLEEVSAQLQGHLQQASLELYAPLDDASFAPGTAVTNLAQSLSVALLDTFATNVGSASAYVPPGSVSVASNSTPAILLAWTDPSSASEEAYYVDRSTAGGAWTNLAALAAHTTNYTDSSAGFGTNYQYRVSYAYAGLRSAYSVSAVVAIPLAVTTSVPPGAVLIDFGRHDGGVNGAVTPSPDGYGHYWNNMGPSAGSVAQNSSITNLVNATNGLTTVAVRVLSTTFQCNGILNGGLTAPDPALLGAFANATATEDYFFVNGTAATGSLRIGGLNPALKYDLRMFATRNTSATDTRTTKYAVTDTNGMHSITLQTSGPGAGSAARPYGNDDTIVALVGLAPSTSGELDLAVTEASGSFAYLGILQISVTSDTPVFVQNPQSIEVAPGTSTSLTAWAASSLPLSYQWYLAGIPIPGGTGTNLPLPVLSVTNAGRYFVTASNWLGVATSAVASVILGPPHLPSSSILVDFGRHDAGVNGLPTGSPDVNGHYWNNMGTSTAAVPQNLTISNLVQLDNTPTTIGIRVLSASFQDNGLQNGGLLAPHYGWLGDFAIATATEDYFFLNNGSSGISGPLRIFGLDPARKYNLSMFATRNSDAATTRTTKYSVTDVNGLHAVTLQTSGPGAGSTNYPYGNDDTIVSLNRLVPNDAGELDLTVTEVAGLYAYLGILQIVPAADASFAGPTPLAGGWRLHFTATAGYAYRVERAPDVTGPWIGLGTVFSPGNSLCIFDDTNAPAGRAFYRTVFP